MARPDQAVPHEVLSPFTKAANLLADLSDLQRVMGVRAPEATRSSIDGNGPHSCWRLFTGPWPAALQSFRELVCTSRSAASDRQPAAPHPSAAAQRLLGAAAEIMNALRGAVRVRDQSRARKCFAVP